MPLPFREKLTLLMPPSLFYRRRIAEEARSGEPELAILDELVPRGGVALDIGSNQGIFAYALSQIAERVIAVEPNPDYAFFARWMLRGRAEVLELAFSNELGNATFYVPISDQGMVLHFAGSLKRTHSQFSNIKTHNVEVRRLDDFGFMDVRFIKADVEGSELEVLDGARATIARDRPVILLELLSGTQTRRLCRRPKFSDHWHELLQSELGTPHGWEKIIRSSMVMIACAFACVAAWSALSMSLAVRTASGCSTRSSVFAVGSISFNCNPWPRCSRSPANGRPNGVVIAAGPKQKGPRNSSVQSRDTPYGSATDSSF